MQTSLNRLPKSTIELTITIPWDEVKKVYDKALDKVTENTELDGFRKGKAPKNLVEEKIGKTKIFEEVIRDLIPVVYEQSIKDQNIKPIASPKIEVIKAQEDSDWQIKAITCEKPKVDLNNYKGEITKVNAKAKIWVPGKDEAPKDNQPHLPDSKKPSLEELLTKLLSIAKVEIPDLLVEEEVNRSLAKLVDQTQSLGLSTEDYLKAKGLTQESIRNQYEKQSRDTLSLEFILEEIAETEGIIVSEDEIKTAIDKYPDEKTKEALRHDSYFLASILRRQKTLDFLLNL